MPTGKTFSKRLHKWIDKETTKAFDYENEANEGVSFLISFFRWYPDYYADLLRDENAEYELELPQRYMMRLLARYRNVFITGVRGLTKTYIMLLSKMIEGVLFPGEIMQYTAPNYKQAATLATQAYRQIAKDYPALAQMWEVRNERQDMFRITTPYGSEFTMYMPRGSNCSQTVAEEINSEGGKDDTFDMEKYENTILPTCRLVRKINRKTDPTHINLKHSHISNASSKQNRGYTNHRHKALKDMLFGEKYDGYVVDISWVTALMCNLRDINYIKDQQSKLTADSWLREMCARYTGTGENPLVADEILAKAKVLPVMEERHCGNKNAIYIVSHDVSYADGRKNAKCADIVVKLTPYSTVNKRDKFRKQVVYVDNYAPPKTAYLQARRLKDLWIKYCMNGANATYLVVDAHAYGTEVVEELMKPSTDGTPNLCCYEHIRFQEIEQPHALPIIYPMKAGTRGVTDEDGAMISYAQSEFEQGNIELLVGNVLEGVDAYKEYHGIKDISADTRIAMPYKNNELLCQQIQNLKTQVSGLTLKEVRKSKAIQRDIWSALKYALRVAQILESKLKKEKYSSKSSWDQAIANMSAGGAVNPIAGANNTRNKLLGMRKR